MRGKTYPGSFPAFFISKYSNLQQTWCGTALQYAALFFIQIRIQKPLGRGRCSAAAQCFLLTFTADDYLPSVNLKFLTNPGNTDSPR
jgi:hypothetical protein